MAKENVGHIAGLDNDVILGIKKPEARPFAREAVRVVMFDLNSKVALLHIKSRDVYKLPGGGVQGEEELSQAREREISEETGHLLVNVVKLGITTEDRGANGMIQISHCYMAQGVFKEKPHFDPEEVSEGFELVWVEDIDEAIRLVNGATSTLKDDLYIKVRDTAILNSAKQKIQSYNGV